MLSSDVGDAAMRLAAETPSRAGSGVVRGPIVQTSPDEWWRQDLTGSAQGNVSAGTGGDIWADAMRTPMIESGGGRSPDFISDPNLDWIGDPSVSSPSGEPTVQTTNTDPVLPTFPDEPLFPILNPADQTVTGNASGDAGLTSTGGFAQVHGGGVGTGLQGGNNLTLGEFFNTPLAAMHYGEGYPPVETRIGSVAGAIPTGAVQIDPSTGQPYDLSGIPEATLDVQTTTYPDIRPGTVPTEGDTGEPNNPYGPPGQFDAWPSAVRTESNAPEGMTIIGHDTITGQPIYRDAQGNLHVNPGTGTPVPQLHTTRSFADNPNQGGAYAGEFNQVGRGREEGNISFPWMTGSRLRHLDPLTGDVSVGGTYNPNRQPRQAGPGSIRDTQAWVEAQARLAYPGGINAPGVRGIPSRSG